MKHNLKSTEERKTKTVPFIRIQKKDWSKLLLNLQREGYKKTPIADMLGISKFVLQKIADGKKEPDFSVGEALILLEKGCTKCAQSQTPIL